MKSDDKTNAMRLLDGKKIPYSSRSYTPNPAMSGEDIAEILGKIRFVYSRLLSLKAETALLTTYSSFL